MNSVCPRLGSRFLTWKGHLPWLFLCAPDLTAFGPGTQAGGGGPASLELEWNPTNLYPS